MQTKSELRKALRAVRREHVEGLPDAIRGLLFRHPPAALLANIPPDASVGLYHAATDEAPASHYAGFFHERGHAIALPRLATRDAAMDFARHSDPHGESDLVPSPFGVLQPGAGADPLVPDVLFVPLVGFTTQGGRLGQGGGHYDRWLAAHPQTIAIGLAWDCQLVESLPQEPHDAMLDAVVTPTRLYGPF